MLECVVNISEGNDRGRLDELARACSKSLLDVHSDPFHNRSVFTLAGPDVARDVRALAVAAVESIDLARHVGVHPRVGAVDVVPFVPLEGSTLEEAMAARDDFARWIVEELSVPAFIYGPERTLPQIRKDAFVRLVPLGPTSPHPTAGAVCVGARSLLVAFNMWLGIPDMPTARRAAKALRSPDVRTLALAVGDRVQLSCNLVNPFEVGPAQVFDAASEFVYIEACELVGLISLETLMKQPIERWNQLDLSRSRTIEARLDVGGLR